MFFSLLISLSFNLPSVHLPPVYSDSPRDEFPECRALNGRENGPVYTCPKK